MHFRVSREKLKMLEAILCFEFETWAEQSLIRSLTYRHFNRKWVEDNLLISHLGELMEKKWNMSCKVKIMKKNLKENLYLHICGYWKRYSEKSLSKSWKCILHCWCYFVRFAPIAVSACSAEFKLWCTKGYPFNTILPFRKSRQRKIHL